MSQRRELAGHRTTVHGIRKQLLEKAAHVVSASIQQYALPSVENCGELANVSGVGRNGERAKPLLDFQIINEIRNDAGIGFGRHRLSMRVIGHC